MKWRHVVAMGAMAAIPLADGADAQEALTAELGGFGRVGTYGDGLDLDSGLLGGGRLGVFLVPNLSVEADWSYGEPSLESPFTFEGEERTWLSHEHVAVRLLYNMPLQERLGLLLGGGYTHDNFWRVRQEGVAPNGHGIGGLVGLRYNLTERFSLRAEGTGNYMVSSDGDTDINPFNLGAQLGLSSYFLSSARVEEVELPPPPPDTVYREVEVEVEPERPSGEPAVLCLSTGEEIQIEITAQGDTLVGPEKTRVQDLRPGVVFAGTYAEGRAWFDEDEAIEFGDYEDRPLEYVKSGGEIGLECPEITRVGEYQGVPVFADVGAEEPYETVYIPVRPGIWQAYETDLAEVRGQ